MNDMRRGDRFGRLVVARRIGRQGKSLIWEFACDCGALHQCDGSQVRGGKIRSCGCLKRDLNRTQLTTHGLTGHPLHSTWMRMRNRCLNEKSDDFPRYGGRGITICERWESFAAFVKDMGLRPSPSHSLDRIDNDGPYSPDNCRWATRVEQSRNRRSNKRVSMDGRTLTLAEWSEVTGIPLSRISVRLTSGWSVERALTEPSRKAVTQ
jgi:hypothetical protein